MVLHFCKSKPTGLSRRLYISLEFLFMQAYIHMHTVTLHALSLLTSLSHLVFFFHPFHLPLQCVLPSSYSTCRPCMHPLPHFSFIFHLSHSLSLSLYSYPYSSLGSLLEHAPASSSPSPHATRFFPRHFTPSFSLRSLTAVHPPLPRCSSLSSLASLVPSPPAFAAHSERFPPPSPSPPFPSPGPRRVSLSLLRSFIA